MTVYCHKFYLNCVTGNSEVESKGKRRIPERKVDTQRLVRPTMDDMGNGNVNSCKPRNDEAG